MADTDTGIQPKRTGLTRTQKRRPSRGAQYAVLAAAVIAFALTADWGRLQNQFAQPGIAKQLFAAMGIARDDKEARQDWVLRGFRQFGAPVSIVVTYDRSIHGSDIAPFDCGGVVNCIVNAAWSRGLGCVINSQGIMQSPVVREEAGIPDDQVIQTCIAMGWPDESFPANAVISQRKSVDEAATFRGFED